MKKTLPFLLKHLALSGIILGALLPLVAAADVVPLAPIPTFGNDIQTLPGYINAVFQIVIGVAAILAVLRIIWGGFQYMTSEAVGQTKDARNIITMAISGLILLLASWLILNIINPNITSLEALQFNALEEVPAITNPAREPGTVTTSTQEYGTSPNKITKAQADLLRRERYKTEEEANAAARACGNTVCTVRRGTLRVDVLNVGPLNDVWRINVDQNTVLKTTTQKADSVEELNQILAECPGLAVVTKTTTTTYVQNSNNLTFEDRYEVVCNQ